MKYPIFSIRDHKVGFSPQLIVQDNDAAAARGFAFLVSNNKTVMGFRATDYSLYKTGVFDSDSGIIEPVMPPEFICDGGNVNEESESENS